LLSSLVRLAKVSLVGEDDHRNRQPYAILVPGMNFGKGSSRAMSVISAHSGMLCLGASTLAARQRHA
jgi:3-isopropylmalate dehydratase small subunit